MKVLAGLCGLQTGPLNALTIVERLSAIQMAFLDGTWASLKTDASTFNWFRRADRPARPSDRLGPYKFLPTPLDPVTVTAEIQQDLRRYLGIDSQSWEDDGNVVVDCFGWMRDIQYDGEDTELTGMTIWDVILQESEMYRHHLREIGGKPNYGWSRLHFYGLGQQVVRMDPKYYLMYVALRSDQHHNLVSYPYYCKHQVEGDRTFFRHIDVNIPDLDKAGRGASMIQGTMSVDDEQEDDCMVVVPGMHKHVKEWTKRLDQRGLLAASFVHRITDQHLTQQDLSDFNTNWTPVPCKAGQVRITDPAIPHGAQGPARRTRRTFLPWYMSLQADSELLEVVEAGTFSELSAAHRDLVPAKTSPLGRSNRYGAPPFAFPAAIPIEGLGAVADAIVARIRPTNSRVLSEKNLLFRGTDAQRDAYIRNFRKLAVFKVVEGFKLVKQSEMQAYGTNSYFYRLERGISLPVAEYDEEPDHDYEVNATQLAPAHGHEEEPEELEDRLQH